MNAKPSGIIHQSRQLSYNICGTLQIPPLAPLSPETMLMFEISSLKFKVWSLRFEVWRLKVEIWELRFEIWSLRFAVWGLRLAVCDAILTIGSLLRNGARCCRSRREIQRCSCVRMKKGAKMCGWWSSSSVPIRFISETHASLTRLQVEGNILRGCNAIGCWVFMIIMLVI